MVLKWWYYTHFKIMAMDCNTCLVTCCRHFFLHCFNQNEIKTMCIYTYTHTHTYIYICSYIYIYTLYTHRKDIYIYEMFGTNLLSGFTSLNKLFYIYYWQIIFHTCCEKANDEPLLHKAFIKVSQK